jgi:hypothetical protein
VASAPTKDESRIDALNRVWRNKLGQLAKYELPVVMIAPATKEPMDDASVARIFERVNRTGQRLGAFDLSVARAYGPAGNLRDLWDDARLSDSMIDRWLGDNGLREDGMPLLRAIALRREPGDVRQGAVLALPPELITSEWRGAVEATGRVLRFFSRRCGALEAAWLPYRAMLVIMIAFAMSRDLEQHRSLLERWFWTRSFSLRFEVAANTRTVEEYGVLNRAIETGNFPVEPVRESVLVRATRRRFAAAFRATMCLLATHDPVDLAGGALGLAAASESGDGVPPDVVFQSIVPTLGESTDDLHLRSIGMAFAARTTARGLRRGEILSLAYPTALRTQLIPEPLPHDAAAFLRERAALVAHELWQRARQPLDQITGADLG